MNMRSNNPFNRTAEHTPLGCLYPPRAASGYFRRWVVAHQTSCRNGAKYQLCAVYLFRSLLQNFRVEVIPSVIDRPLLQ